MDHHFHHAVQYDQHYPHHQVLHHHQQQQQLAFERHFDRQSPMIMPLQQKTETKPRLGKDEVDSLEREFQKNPKPTTNTKKQFADQMSVDLSRINNWFQNRRAKRKQEKKQEAYEAGQREAALGFTDDESTDLLNNTYYDDVLAPSYHLITAPPPAIAPYNPQYSDPTEATLESLERTMAAAATAAAAAQPISHEEFHTGFVRTDGLPNFGGPLVLHGGPDTDRARFPTPTASRFQEAMYNSNPATFANSPVHLEAPHVYNTYPMPCNSGTFSDASVGDYCSQLLSETPSPESSNDGLNAAVSNLSRSPPSSESLKSPPPPMDIAARRRVQHKPAALGMDTIRSRPAVGPRTVSQADNFRRPLGSPSSSPLRRIASAGPNNNSVMSGRIHKSGIRSAQRSPIDLRFFAEAMERSHTAHLPTTLGMGPSSQSSLAPPTPLSPLDMTMRSNTSSVSSSPEGDVNYLYAGPSTDMFAADGEANITSPPVTPAPNIWLQNTEFKFSAQDESLYTPANEEFPIHFPGELQMPPYLSTGSQPVTPAFGEFNQNFLFNESPQYTLASSSHDYSFSESLPNFSAAGYLLGHSPQNKQKKFQFSNSTPADFNEK